MTTIDWKALKPHVPLGPGDAQYIERAGSAGAEIAQWILTDRSPLLVGGPAGVGKSTELARAAELLQPHRVACLVQIDRFENMRNLTPDRLLRRIMQRLGYLAQSVLRLPLSPDLEKAFAAANEEWDPIPTLFSRSRVSSLNSALAEVLRVSKQRKLTLLIDGLEKVPQGPGSIELFEALGSIREEVELVMVIPWHAAFGPQAESVIRSGERFVTVRPLEVDGLDGEPGRAFLNALLMRRLGLDRHLNEAEGLVCDDAIRWSGGVPRVFLQLMADAGSYAKLRGHAPWPLAEDLADAVADQVDGFHRLLLPGDAAAIRAVVGTTGTELELERKVRLMAHGVLLERLRGGVRILDVHPLAQAAFGNGGSNA